MFDAEDAAVEFRIVYAQADEPTEQEVAAELFDELVLAADREEDLHEQRAHIGENAIEQSAQGAQRVVLRHALFQAEVADHRRPGILLATRVKSDESIRTI